MPAPAIRFLYVTCPDLAQATLLAETVVVERLAACANILPEMQAIYHWRGALEHGREVVVVLKTTAARTRRLCDRIRSLHPYEIPCIVVLPVVGGHAPFLAWVAEQVATPPTSPTPATTKSSRNLSI